VDPTQTGCDTPKEDTKTLTEAERAETIGPYTMEHLLEAYEADLQRSLMYLPFSNDAGRQSDIMLSITVKSNDS